MHNMMENRIFYHWDNNHNYLVFLFYKSGAWYRALCDYVFFCLLWVVKGDWRGLTIWSIGGIDNIPKSLGLKKNLKLIQLNGVDSDIL